MAKLEEEPSADWADPISLVPPTMRRALGRDPGFANLFLVLAREGPSKVPMQRTAAEFTGRSVSTFKRHLRFFSGRSWTDFVITWRLQYGEDQLVRSIRSMKEISRSCGFDHTGSFTRAFRKKYGQTPMKWRRLHWGHRTRAPDLLSSEE